MEAVEVTLSDLMLPVNKPNFAAAWDALDGKFAAEDTFELSSASGLEDAVTKLVAFLGMQPCEKSDKVNADKATHVLYLSGVYVGGHEVLARAKLAFDGVVTLQFTGTSPSHCRIFVSLVR